MFELIKVVVAILSLLFVLKNLSSCNCKYTIYVVLVVWLRFFLSAFHEITYSPLIAGLTINALSSIFVVSIGLVLLPARMFLFKKFVPFYLFILVIVLSGLFNGELKGLINVFVKWLYFLTLVSALVLGMVKNGIDITLKRLLYAFLMPMTLLLLSVLLGEFKATENDGSASYVGGYNHEAAFSMIVIGFILSISFLKSKTVIYQSSIFWLSVFLLFLVNYRTAIITVLPVIIIFILTSVDNKIESRMRVPVLVVSTVILAVIGIIVSSSFGERFADISVVISSWDSLIKAPIYFTEIERDLFSARVYLWSQYLYELLNADFFHRLVGFGPESWSDNFELYAHNTYVSYLYEYGYLGLFFFAILNLYLFVICFSINNSSLKNKLSFSLLGFLIMNLATMPIWSIEGLIMYAIIVATIFAGRLNSMVVNASMVNTSSLNGAID